MIRGRTDAPLSSLTTLEVEHESHLRSEEEAERLDLLGQESDLKAAPWINEENRNQERLQRQDWEQDMQILQTLRRQKHAKPYYRYLVQILHKFSLEENISRKYPVLIEIDDKGIVVKIKGTKYLGAFKPSGFPSYDRNYCKILAMKLGNTVAKLEGYRRKSEGGIILPDQEDNKIYGS